MTHYYHTFASVYKNLRDAIEAEAESRGYSCWGCYPWAEQTHSGHAVWLVRVGWFDSSEDSHWAMNDIEDTVMATWKPEP